MSETPDKTVIQKTPRSPLPDTTRIVARKAHASTTAVAAEAPPDATLITSKAGSTSKKSPVVGRILKQRFELVALLGSGGMGAVYKAKDLRQVEAGDQSPWVAVKVINESFSCHEHALVALQQETKKTQRLAHPHIVSVYDFDREGDTAFMTMELLEGQSLDQVLARKPGGLPLHDAQTMIRQICQAVSYAHRQGIIHADLKPANIFLTRDNQVKILDFGIAHAMQGGSHFDAHVLNALTPAYASVRMLAGHRPQPQDDLYALGCIFYLLLTGKHPFQRKRATEADATRLAPARISHLDKRQWRALQTLLVFQPEIPISLDAFQRNFFNEQRDIRVLYQRVAIGAVLVLALSVGINFYLNRNVRQLAEQLTSTDLSQVQQAVQNIRQLSGSDKVVVLDRARDEIGDSIEQQLPALETATQFQQLSAYVQAVGGLYPDSSRIQDGIRQFEQRRHRFVEALADQLQQRISQRNFAAQPESFSRQMYDLERVAAGHALLQQDLKNLMAQEAGIAAYLGQSEKAEAILTEADQLFPEDSARFQKIRDRLNRTPSHETRSPASDTLVQQDETLMALQELLQQFPLDQQPEQLTLFLQALSSVDRSLYYVLRQGIKEFMAGQMQAGNGQSFAGMQQKLFGAAPVLAVAQKEPRRLDPCSIRLANQGKQSGRRCRDTLTRAHTGPELVVIKANGIPPFAITRSEISINDFNRYCSIYRRCTPQPASQLPLTGVDLQQAHFYAQWLSRMTGYEYRLPTLEEWRAAARDDSGVSDHNCIVNVSGRQVRGNALRPVDQGYANSLGLLNVFGNVEEWVQSGNQVLVVGGGANVPITECNNVSSNDQNVESSTSFRGFRLVRELKS